MSRVEYVDAFLQNAVLRWGTLADYSVDPFTPDDPYVGPLGGEDKPCTCSTVTWSLFAACATCQNGSPISYANVAMYDSVAFPNPVSRGSDGVNGQPIVRVRSFLGIYPPSP